MIACLTGSGSVCQDVSPEDIPIMLVGNKCDLRQDRANCVPTTYGEKLAMVMIQIVWTGSLQQMLCSIVLV